jgi:integrase/recombinase XerC
MNIAQYATNFIDTVKLSRSENTARSYKNALTSFFLVLKEYWIDPETDSIDKLNEEAIAWFAAYLKNYSPATERLYLQAVKGFYEYLAAEKANEVNLSRLKLLIRQRARRSGIRLPQFPREKIEKIIQFVWKFPEMQFQGPNDKLRALRDRAFVITLADTGLRVHEACGLRRGDIDWNEGRAIIVGKGNKQAIVRFSIRSMDALRDYLNARSKLDGASGLPLAALPLFARHDKGAGKKIKMITTTTGRNLVAENVRLALGDLADRSITPHSFRHYFVTTVLRASGNLKLAQELARHTNISVTQRYAHLSNDELDKGYFTIFDSKDKKTED